MYRVWYMVISMLCCRAKYYVAFTLGKFKQIVWLITGLKFKVLVMFVNQINKKIKYRPS